MVDDFQKISDYLDSHKEEKIRPRTLQINIPNAEEHLRRGIEYFMKNDAQWAEEYSQIVDWLTDNKGKGLIMTGSCGRGKTLIGATIMPILFYYYLSYKRLSVFTAQEMNKMPDKVMATKYKYIDDIGTENELVEYGNRRQIFPEVVDDCERRGLLLICSTNLTTSEIETKYGIRTKDRLKAITKIVPFAGESFRK